MSYLFYFLHVPLIHTEGLYRHPFIVIVEQAVVYSTLPQEYSTLTFGRGVVAVVVEWKRGAK